MAEINEVEDSKEDIKSKPDKRKKLNVKKSSKKMAVKI